MAQSMHVVCFGAHPDDAEIFASGTLLALKAAGATLTLVVATDGSLSEGYPANPALAKTRAAEAAAGAAVLGADLDMLGFADGYLSMASEAQGVINERLERYQPDLVITHHPNDVHRDHREISRLVTARIDPGVKLAYWEPMLGLSAHPQLLVDISAHTETKATAIVVHRSQHAEETILPSIRTWNAFRGLQLGGRDVTAAEGWVMPPSPFINPQRMLASAARTRALWT